MLEGLFVIHVLMSVLSSIVHDRVEMCYCVKEPFVRNYWYIPLNPAAFPDLANTHLSLNKK